MWLIFGDDDLHRAAGNWRARLPIDIVRDFVEIDCEAMMGEAMGSSYTCPWPWLMLYYSSGRLLVIYPSRQDKCLKRTANVPSSPLARDVNGEW